MMVVGLLDHRTTVNNTFFRKKKTLAGALTSNRDLTICFDCFRSMANPVLPSVPLCPLMIDTQASSFARSVVAGGHARACK